MSTTTDLSPSQNSPPPADNRKYIIWGLAAIALVAVIYLFFVFKRDHNHSANDPVVFDDEILEKSGRCSIKDDTCDPTPPVKNMRILTAEEIATIQAAADAHVESTPMSYFEMLRGMIHDKEFRHAYVNNLLRYYKGMGRLLIELEANTAKENKIGSSAVDIQSMIDISTNSSSIREIKAYYGNILRTRSPNFNLEAVIRELDGMSGRNEIKEFIARKIISFGTNFKTFMNTFQHTILMAPPGYGKTHIAKIISKCLSLAGFVLDDRLLITTKKSFVSAYINHTTTLTRNTLMRSIGGLLFIDEAYSLAVNEFGVQDHGHESLAEIVNFIDKYRGLNIIVAAGYENEMKKNFLGVNEGMGRRFPTKLILSHYDARDLAHICMRKIIDNDGFTKLNDDELADAANVIFTLISAFGPDTRTNFPRQAGDMDNYAAEIITNLATISDYRVAIMRAFTRVIE